MAIDKKRAKQFNLDLQDLQQQLDFEEFYETFKAKLLDLIARNEIEGETLASYIRQIKRVFEPEYVKYVDRIYGAYNYTLNLVNQHYQDVGVDVNRDLSKIQAIEKVNLTRLGGYEDSTVREISKIVRSGIAEAKQHTAIAADLAKIDDQVNSYANTLARTQVKGYGQTLKNEKARLGKIYYFEYVGIIRPTTRTFCLELLGQNDPTFHLNDIRQMQNAQIGNVADYRGGYNCHHDWEPDPFFKDEKYKIRFYTIQQGKKTLKLAKRA